MYHLPVHGASGGRALGVRPREVVDALERGEPIKGAVSAEAIVGVEGGGQSGETVAFVFVRVGVGPDLEQGADEAFDLAVGLRPVGAGLADGDRLSVAGLAPATLEAGAVVGENALDRDPVPAVEAHAGLEEADRGGGGL